MITATELYNFFKVNGIYVGAIDRIRAWDDEIDDEVEAGYLICFSSHDNRIIIPIAILIDLQQMCEGYNVQIEQRGCKECGKQLYMYIRIYNPKYDE